MKYIILFLMMFSINVYATPTLYIQGNKAPVHYLINDNILKYNIQNEPGGHAKSLLQDLKGDDNSFAFINSATLFLENDSSDILKDFKIIAALVNINFTLAKKTGHVLNKEKILVGGYGKFGYCNVMVDYYAKKNNLQYKYIPYNTAASKDLDLLAERLDIACMGNNTLLDNKSVETVHDFNKDGFKFILFLIANKNISKEKEKEVVTLIKNANTPVMHKLFKEQDFDLLLETEEKKDATFIQQYNFWNNMKGKK